MSSLENFYTLNSKQFSIETPPPSSEVYQPYATHEYDSFCFVADHRDK